ncbi:prephenate dehydrogenase [Clostridium saccharoperbutylacetonicum]|uniref:Prephenate dehydrogenase TyrA n=1 Tax=Clostridium saccharoperbutylacetonicum N1-4(HMT) TaxID=931276 RepID=M1N6L6_9CLOT|nr:prephenate dehydrogenase [Clostridium saccharoperbutylacetonicum]AGF59047.1 prephenate dehydrogenase TyrA [Clostridium saccharoperbutylacetonicum N1-4(HMT)]AQR97716.1 ketol-acid reductoisomerase [Clostridium saccharoperbutylacetonicum]NRT60165.1 prephenate dehydrogenase [Clostridium saccharoperbutylacetonicum]NSB23477.1 prephenate dehydrogenase [Clostridium saccharoperbutylacetonicum]NSB33604.1 prephenate dehydrogenase [Clostridium saccharoperbutylacetonicum]
MKIVVVGLGVIGGSFTMALKEAGYNDVYGIDTNEETLVKAKKLGLIKEGFTSGEEIVKDADLIIMSLYPRLVKKFITDNKDNFKDGAVITDATGIKKMFIGHIVEILPSNIDFVFGHPMAGREKKGIDFATSEVFKGANYILTPVDRNKEENLKLIEDLAYEIGFKRVKRINPEYHDEMIGFTSQLPHALAVALVNSDVEGRDTGSFIGDSYRDLTRIANINEDLWSELFLGNKENLLMSIQNFENELDKIKYAIKDNDIESLKQLFIKSTKRREKL